MKEFNGFLVCRGLRTRNGRKIPRPRLAPPASLVHNSSYRKENKHFISPLNGLFSIETPTQTHSHPLTFHLFSIHYI